MGRLHNHCAPPHPPFPRVPVQFGHLFAKGETRDAALRNMVVALRDIAIRGEIRTIVDYVLDMVQVGEGGGLWVRGWGGMVQVGGTLVRSLD